MQRSAQRSANSAYCALRHPARLASCVPSVLSYARCSTSALRQVRVMSVSVQCPAYAPFFGFAGVASAVSLHVPPGSPCSNTFCSCR
jgi:hypothetical protein